MKNLAVAISPTLETMSLQLRVPIEEDLAAWTAMLGDYPESRFIGGPLSRPEAWRVMATMLGHWQLRGYGQFTVVEKSTGECVGRVGAWMPEAWPGKEIGWALRPDKLGRGYATEATIAAIDWAFNDLGWTEVIHCIHPDNKRSAALANRIGARLITRATLPPPMNTYVCDIYGQSREDWESRPKIPAVLSAG